MAHHYIWCVVLTIQQEILNQISTEARCRRQIRELLEILPATFRIALKQFLYVLVYKLAADKMIT